ncbi:MAG: LON peptidase substrate-binding domain-containing protein [Pseudomonadales bacterium]
MSAVSHYPELPLFPLGTVLFQDGLLPLQIFEPRYLDLVARCMKEQAPFGVVLIRSGRDARATAEEAAPEIFDIGTAAHIVDFNQLSNGRLGITVQGGEKFRIRRVREADDHLLIGEVSYLPEEPKIGVGEEHQDLVDLLNQLMIHPGVARLKLQIDFSDARSVGWRLAELLPIDAEIKQSLLQLQLPRERLQELTRLVHKLRG